MAGLAQHLGETGADVSVSDMAWVFVQGMVRWHHRHDLLKRFPEGWPEYKANVPEWIPRWRPWVPSPAHATLREEDKTLLRILGSATGLDIEIRDGATKYQPAQDPRYFTGIEARLFALTHVNFAWAVAAHAALLVVMATKYMMAHLRQPEQVRT